MQTNIIEIPRILNKESIDDAINDYRQLLKEIPLEIQSNDILAFLMELKRGKLEKGPYIGISIFEAANRIMTDLTILYGVKDLLNNKILPIEFLEFEVEYGNENKNEHDIISYSKNQELIGEAFNVSKSFFYSKKSTALRKLKGSSRNNAIKLLLFNDDAVNKKGLLFKDEVNKEYHYAVEIK